MSNPHSSGMRGLTNFIKEVRECPNRNAEKERVRLEIAKFQTVFQRNMGSYQRKKYICKLLYIFLLGYKVDMGKNAAIQLCTAKKFSEKQVGYLAVGILLQDTAEDLEPLIEVLRADLDSTNFEHQALAITAIANIGGSRLARIFAEPIINILMSQNSTTHLKKKSAICLLRFLKQRDELVTPEFMFLKLHQLLKLNHLGLLNALVGFLMGMVEVDSDIGKYAEFLPRILDILHWIVVTYASSAKTAHYEYFGVPNPWLQIRLLQFLQHFEIPEAPAIRKPWVEVITALLNEPRITQRDESSRFLTAKNAVLMEVFVLAIKLKSDAELKRSVFLLVEFLGAETHTMKGLAVEKLLQITRLCPEVAKFACHHFKAIFPILNSSDRKRREQAVELLHLISVPENITSIVQEFLTLISMGDVLSAQIADKLLSLTERAIPTNPQWYVEVMIRLFSIYGGRLSDTVSNNFLFVVSNNQALHAYAAKLLVTFSTAPTTNHNDFLTLLTARILRDFGPLISTETGFEPINQYTALTAKYDQRSVAVQMEVRLTLDVFQRIYPGLQGAITQFLTAAPQRPSELSKPPVTHAPPPVPAHSSVHVPAPQPPPQVTVHIPPVEQERGHYDAAEPLMTHEASNPFEPPQTDEFRGLLLHGRGVLLQTDELQVGVMVEHAQSQVTLSLYYGNLSDSQALTNLDVSVTNPDMNALNFSAEQPPGMLQPLEQVLQRVFVTCSQEFIGVPQFTVSYVMGGKQFSSSTHLPVASLSFISAYPVNSTDFLAAWAMINGPPQEFQHVWRTQSNLQVQRVLEAIPVSRFSVISGVDPSPSNLVLSCQLHTVAQSLPALCRIESDEASSMFRVTSKCYSPVFAASLALLLKLFIN